MKSKYIYLLLSLVILGCIARTMVNCAIHYDDIVRFGWATRCDKEQHQHGKKSILEQKD